MKTLPGTLFLLMLFAIHGCGSNQAPINASIAKPFSNEKIDEILSKIEQLPPQERKVAAQRVLDKIMTNGTDDQKTRIEKCLY